MRKNLTTLATLLLLLGAGCADTSSVSTEPTSNGEAAEVTAPVSGRLDLSDQGLTALPKSVLDRTELRELDISGNRIGGALPAEIGKLKALRILDASGNLMTGVPAEIGRLSELRLLDLSDNELIGLPYELANLKKLVTLDLRGNDVSEADLGVIRAGLTTTEILTD